MSSRQLLNPSNVAPPAPSYSHISVVPIGKGVRLIHLAGQIGREESGNMAKDFPSQVEVALQNVKRCLAAVDASISDIVKVTHYVVNMLPIDPRRVEIYTKFMGDHRPPSTLVGVESLADKEMLYEIEVVAISNT